MTQQAEEKVRQANYYHWERLTKSFADQINSWKVQEAHVKDLAKQMSGLAMEAETAGMKETLEHFNVQLLLGTEPATVPYPMLHKFILKKALACKDDEYVQCNYGTFKAICTAENPHHHPLTKSMNIYPLDAEFVANHQIITKAVYEALAAGEPVEDGKGMWNTTLEELQKAVTAANLHMYNKVRKLIHRNGKTYIATYYVNKNDATDIQIDQDHKSFTDAHVHHLAHIGLDIGDEVIIDVNGQPMKGTIRRFETDGSVRLLMEDGKKTNKKLADFAKLVQQGKIQVVGKGGLSSTPINVKAATQQPTDAFPTSLSDLTHIKFLGGSTGADLYSDKNGNQFVVKKGGNPDQALAEALANNMYLAFGVNAPESQIVDGAMVTRFVGNVNDLNSANQALTDNLRDGVSQHFAVHALLANYDVVENDNTKYDPVTGAIWHLDNGGSLMYRAQGGLKTDWNAKVSQLVSMRNFSGNQKKWFGKLSDGDIVAQIENQILPNQQKILTLVQQSQLKPMDRAKLYKTMKDRFTFLEDYVKQYHAKTVNQNPVVKVDVTKQTPGDIVKANSAQNNYGTIDLDAIQKTIDHLKKNGSGVAGASGKSYYDDAIGFYDMNTVCKARGFDKRPVVIDHKDFEALFLKTKNDPNVELAYRTVNSGYEDRFKNDVNFYTGGYGQSVYGAGVYFCAETSPQGLSAVPPPPSTSCYSDSRGYGDITHYAIIPDSFKWADEGDIKTEISNLKNNKVVNPAYQAAKDAHDDATKAAKAYATTFTDNIHKQHNYDKNIGDYLSQVWQQRNWKEADVHHLASLVNKAGGKATLRGSNMTLEMPADAHGKVFKETFTFTGSDGTHKYNTMVKGLFNRIQDNYVTPINNLANATNLHNDKTYMKLAGDLQNTLVTLQNTPPSIPGNMHPDDKKILDMLQNHRADSEIGLYAAIKGYDGIKTNNGRYRTIFNRSKLILSNKDHI